MKKFNIDDQLLEEVISAAREAMLRSYAPYSGFNMGEAVVTEKNIILPGALVENV